MNKKFDFNLYYILNIINTLLLFIYRISILYFFVFILIYHIYIYIIILLFYYLASFVTNKFNMLLDGFI